MSGMSVIGSVRDTDLLDQITFWSGKSVPISTGTDFQSGSGHPWSRSI